MGKHNQEKLKNIGEAIRNQAGLLADFVENNTERTQKEDLYANIFLCFAGIIGAIVHLDIPAQELADIVGQLFNRETGIAVFSLLSKWRGEARKGGE